MIKINSDGLFITRPLIGSQWSRNGETYQVAATHGAFVIMEGCKRVSAITLVNEFEPEGVSS